MATYPSTGHAILARINIENRLNIQRYGVTFGDPVPLTNYRFDTAVLMRATRWGRYSGAEWIFYNRFPVTAIDPAIFLPHRSLREWYLDVGDRWNIRFGMEDILIYREGDTVRITAPSTSLYFTGSVVYPLGEDTRVPIDEVVTQQQLNGLYFYPAEADHAN